MKNSKICSEHFSEVLETVQGQQSNECESELWWDEWGRVILL